MQNLEARTFWFYILQKIMNIPFYLYTPNIKTIPP